MFSSCHKEGHSGWGEWLRLSTCVSAIYFSATVTVQKHIQYILLCEPGQDQRQLCTCVIHLQHGQAVEWVTNHLSVLQDGVGLVAAPLLVQDRNYRKMGAFTGSICSYTFKIPKLWLIVVIEWLLSFWTVSVLLHSLSPHLSWLRQMSVPPWVWICCKSLPVKREIFIPTVAKCGSKVIAFLLPFPWNIKHCETAVLMDWHYIKRIRCNMCLVLLWQ